MNKTTKTGRLFVILLVSLATFGCTTTSDEPQLLLPEAIQGKIPFDLEALSKAPKFRWDIKSEKDSVWSLYYEGGEFSGKQTEVFAYYASPATLSGKKATEEKYPAIVAMHGGGGTAFAVWAREWAKKGYAAIAMDLSGAKPLPEEEQTGLWATASNQLPNGAPDDTHVFKFFKINEAFTEQWQFHAVSNIIRAHSLIRSFADTDTLRTAVTGISWGGYLTNIVAGIDHRFRAAVPIYGCGFLQEKSAWLARFDTLGLETSEKWVALWDPSSYVGNSKVPMFYINGTNDFAYPVESWQKTIELAPNANQLLILEMIHNHSGGAEPIEIENFIKDVFAGKLNMPKLGKPQKVGKWFVSSIQTEDEVTDVQFLFTKSTEKNKQRKWEVVPATLKGEKLIAEGTHDMRAAYFLVVYKDGRRVSSPVVFN